VIPNDCENLLFPARIWPSDAPFWVNRSGLWVFQHQEGVQEETMAARKTTKSTRRWSGRVTRESNALDLEKDVFRQTSARKIAASLKRSAERSKRRKAGAYGSAMSMLTFYINRAGKNLPDRRKKVLENAKTELRKAFGREE
jgi:hypothetical protein